MHRCTSFLFYLTIHDDADDDDDNNDEKIKWKIIKAYKRKARARERKREGEANKKIERRIV